VIVLRALELVVEVAGGDRVDLERIVAREDARRCCESQGGNGESHDH